MRKKLSVLGVAVITAVAVAIAVVSLRDPVNIPHSGELLFPNLPERLNDVVSIRLQNDNGEFLLSREGEHWLAPAQGNYFADQNRIHRLLVGMSGLVRIEPMTKKPERYVRLGLQAPDATDSRSLRFQILDRDQKTLAALLVGTRRPSVDPNREEMYVLADDDSQAWLVTGKLPDNRQAVDWLEREVIALDRGRIRDVRIEHANGEQVFVFREDPFNEDYALEGIPEKAEIRGQWYVNDIGRFIEELRFESVLPAANETAERQQRLTITTFDGLRVIIILDNHNGRVSARFLAVDDASLRQDFELPKTDVNKPQPNQRHQQALDSHRSFDVVQAETAELNRLWAPWVYELPDFKLEYISKTMSDLINDQ